MLLRVAFAAVCCALLALPLVRSAAAQQESGASSRHAPARIHLILKDGSYQLALDYEVRGNSVQFRSAERDGAVEEIPLADVDLAATERWVRAHTSADAQQRSVLSPELAREEADRASRTPEVASNLRLPEEDAVLALDMFRGQPALVPLAQQGSDLNHETAHATQPIPLNPAASQHRIGEVSGERANVQLHTDQPIFYVRVGDDPHDVVGGGTMTVDTHGAAGRPTPSGGSERSSYVLELIGVRGGLRQLDSFHIADLGRGADAHPDIVELAHDDLPGGHWLKLTPAVPLLPGEYALVEVLSPREVNLDVWDFGVHADAPENLEALHPEVRSTPALQRRTP